jgi:hypothetical protein
MTKNYIYNPRNIKLTNEDKKKLLKALVKDKTQPLTIHLIGNYDKLKDVLDFNEIKIKYPKTNDSLKKREHFNYHNFKMNGCPQYKYNSVNIPSIKVNFINNEDKILLGKKIKKNITNKTKYIHYPNKYESNLKNKIYKTKRDYKSKYPIYVISLGRWEKRKTQKLLEKCNIPYLIVVEPKEYEKYLEHIDKEKILVCPENYSEKMQGSIPVRNFVWEHAVKNNHKAHWILDDNINSFCRINNNVKNKIYSGVMFKAHEDYIEKFNNVYLSGFQYESLMPQRHIRNPFIYNTRIFSCILINHELDNILDERWRGVYNEDVDLSIRVLKKGLGTILNCQFLIDKTSTTRDKGGNTTTIYGNNDENKYLLKAQSLKEQHPDIVNVVNKFIRKYHHTADLTKFKNNDLGYDKNKERYKIKNKKVINNYGMYLS